MVETTARLPYASLDLGDFPLWLLILMYAAIGAGVWTAHRPTPLFPLAGGGEKGGVPRFHLPEIGSATTRLWVGGTAVGSLLVWLAVLSLPDGRLHLAFLDVGQGDAILITTPEGRQILIDGGPTPTDLTWRLGQELPFWDRSLDVVINTHPDADHLAGLPPLLGRYQVDQVLVPDVGTNSNLYREWEAQLAQAQLTPTIGQAGMELTLGRGITATLLNPGPAAAREDDPNNHSVVMRLQMGRISFLLPGDIEEPVERNLVWQQVPLATTVLKSPHHGSKTSSSEVFLEAVNPQVVVISVGKDNDFGHPSPEVLERYAERGLTVFRTDQDGTIEFSTDGERLWVETGR
jgi:competence protein ComEC